MDNTKIENYSQLVIIQSKVQFERYLKEKKSNKDIILPIGPESRYLAELNKLPFVLLKNLLDDNEYKSASKKSVKIIENLIYKLDNYSNQINYKCSLEIGKYYAFQLQIIIGQIHYNYFIAKQLAKNFKRGKILIFSSNKERTFLKYRPNPIDLLSKVILKSNLFSKDRIEHIILKENIELNLNQSILNLFRNRQYYKYFSYYKLKLKFKNISNSNLKFLLITSPYDWINVQKHPLFNQFFQIDLLPFIGRTIQRNLDNNIFNIINESITFNNHIIFDLEKLSNYIGSDLIEFIKKKKKISSKLDSYEGLIGSVLSSPFENFVAHLGAKKNKPFLLWQHGEKGLYEDPFVFSTELNYATHYMTFGEGVKNYYKKYLFKNRLKQISLVGSIGKKIEYEGGTTILYATGKWFYTATPFLEKIDPDTRLFNCQKTILNFLKSSNEVVFKANNTVGLNSIPFSLGNIKLDYNTPFTKLLKKAKVVILDTPATTFIEAASTTVPIFVIGGRSNYLKKAKDLMSKRAVWCETPELLIEKLNIFLKRGIYEADVYDNSLNNLYGSGNFNNEETIQNVLTTLNNIT
jgi:hypothetical protein